MPETLISAKVLSEGGCISPLFRFWIWPCFIFSLCSFPYIIITTLLRFKVRCCVCCESSCDISTVRRICLLLMHHKPVLNYFRIYGLMRGAAQCMRPGTAQPKSGHTRLIWNFTQTRGIFHFLQQEFRFSVSRIQKIEQDSRLPFVLSRRQTSRPMGRITSQASKNPASQPCI